MWNRSSVIAWLIAAGIVTAAHGQGLCGSGFEVAGAPEDATPSPRRRIVRTAVDGTCVFDVRLCANVGPEGCVERPISRLTVHGPARARIDTPQPGSCGSWTPITLTQRGRRTGRRRLRVTMRDQETGRRHSHRLVLLCAPKAEGDDDPPPPNPDPPPTPGASRPCEGITSPPRTVGRLIDFPPSLPIESCAGGYSSSNYATPTALLPADAPAELHIIGVYEGPSPVFGGPPGGLQPPPEQPGIRVTIHPRPKPVVLFLSAYESVRWDLTVEPGATLQQVIAQGYEEQQVTGVPAGVPVVHLGYEQSFGLFYGWELSAGGFDYVQAIDDIRRFTGLTETSFQGCYAGDHFEIAHWTGEPRTCRNSEVAGDEAVPLRDVAFPGCEAVTAESQYCLTTSGGTLALLGIDSGTVCPVATGAPVSLSPIDPSLAWRGEIAYVCQYEAGLVRVSLRDGTSEAAQMPCGAVAVDGGRVLVLAPSADSDGYGFPPMSLYSFSTWEDLIIGAFDASYDVGGFFFSRMTVHDGIVYEAWHAADTIDRVDLASGTQLEPVHLEGYDGWILGLSVTGDGRLLIPGDTWGDTVYVFDAHTGAIEGIVRPTSPVTGLACVDRR